ncbi:apoptosis-associated speck-like protein containing a CARD [Alligator sinensis]|uniref:Apoptosis-associated speck-like protein containing a CARD n=1 Tax=Alligator sinensis TaxID=38654 RepID=A0A1U7SNP0_ALLSI|nr:apoptosis-associated speck-like protein containing a CARD [Alligator sinensis]XP_025051505.1 apoptosis-associated speck-like protein containing a CARD [Alligator sinensis]XP_025051506.1 apoptosis-associated speck-like protein containing a CARD [Alligator sinensis]
MANVRDALIAALDDLEDAKFREFKFKLKGFPVKSGYNRIPWGQLERADRLDLTDKLISFYQEDYAQEVTLGVLRGINMNNVASDFAAACGSSNQLPGPPANATASRAGEHFIDRHRKSLIDRVTTVSPILDELHGDVLQPEQYDTIRSQRTSQEKMRSLYDCVRGWNVACKDKFYAALKKHEQHLVADLEGN